MGLRGVLKSQSATIVVDAVTLVKNRASHAAKGPVKVDAAAIEKSLGRRRRATGPRTAQCHDAKSRKDVTYEHTQDESFSNLVREALPPDVQKRLGKLSCSLPHGKVAGPDRNSRAAARLGDQGALGARRGGRIASEKADAG